MSMQFVLGEIEVNPNSQGGSGRNVSPNQGIILFVFFHPDPTPFPGIGELCSKQFYQKITFVLLIYFFKSILWFFIRCQILYSIIPEKIINVISRVKYYKTTLFQLYYCHLWIFIFSYLKNKTVIIRLLSCFLINSMNIFPSPFHY